MIYMIIEQNKTKKVRNYSSKTLEAKEENKKYFPDAFLYALTNNQEYEQNIEKIKERYHLRSLKIQTDQALSMDEIRVIH